MCGVLEIALLSTQQAELSSFMGFPPRQLKLSIDSKEILVFVKNRTKDVFCNKGFKRGDCWEVKKKNKK